MHGTDGGSRTVKSLHLLSPSRACWHFAAYSLASPTARLYPHQRRDVTNWAKLSPRQYRLHHWRAWLNGFVGWQWRGRMRRQALGLQSPASTAVVGRRALTAIIVLGAIWLLNDYRGVPTPVLLLTLLLLGGMFMATRTAFDDAFMPSAAIWKQHVSPGLTLNAPNLPCSRLTD